MKVAVVLHHNWMNGGADCILVPEIVYVCLTVDRANAWVAANKDDYDSPWHRYEGSDHLVVEVHDVDAE